MSQTDSIQTRMDYDPSINGVARDAKTPDGRKYDTVAWDGGISDIDMRDYFHDMTLEAPCLVVYLPEDNDQPEIFEGEISEFRRKDNYHPVFEVSDGDEVRKMDQSNTVENEAGEELGVMLEIKVPPTWDAIQKLEEAVERQKNEE